MLAAATPALLQLRILFCCSNWLRKAVFYKLFEALETLLCYPEACGILGVTLFFSFFKRFYNCPFFPILFFCIFLFFCNLLFLCRFISFCRFICFLQISFFFADFSFFCNFLSFCNFLFYLQWRRTFAVWTLFELWLYILVLMWPHQSREWFSVPA